MHRPLGARVNGGHRARRGAAFAGAAMGIAGPLIVSALLPDPRTQVALLSDAHPAAVIGALAVLLATGVVHLLLAWAAIVVLAALVSRAPGAAGRAARAVLRRIAPALVRQVLVTTAGLSLATSLAACGTQLPPGPPTTASASLNGSAADSSLAARAWPAPAESGPVAAVRGTARPAALTSPAAALRSDPGDAPAAGAGAVQTGAITLELDWPTEHPSTDNGFEVTFDLDWPTTPEPAAAPLTEHRAAENDTPPVTGQETATAEEARAPATGSDAAGEPATDAGMSTLAQAGQAAPTTPAAHTEAVTAVTVQAGDSLWSIAAAHLPPDAGHAQIDAAWRAWYAANLEIIGPDPSLILPGQHLRAPTAAPRPHAVRPPLGGPL